MSADPLALMREAWGRLRALGPSWFWFAHGMKNGDLYQACALAPAFRAVHGTAIPIRLIVDSGSALEVAKLFAGHVEAIHMGEFSQPAAVWEAFVAEERLARFGPDTPILLHPLRHPETRALGGFVVENGLTWLALYRQILRLPGDAEPAAPDADPSRAAAAEALCDAHGLRPGRAAIFFPYAQSFPVSAQAHFVRLAERMRGQGLDLFTSVAGAETPVPGTTPIAIPFSLLPDVAERAGWVVAVRSGICDIVAPTRVRKSFVFRHGGELPLWGTAAMGLCRDAFELPFDFPARSPDAFADAVLSDEAELPPLRARRGISDEVRGRDGAPAPTSSFVALQRGEIGPETWTAQAAERLDGVSGCVRLTDLPERRHPRWREALDGALRMLAVRPDASGWAFHACRDGPGLDAFEPVGRGALLDGSYHAAASWHTLIATRGAPFTDFLPPASRQRLLPDEAMAVGRPVVLAQGWGGPDMTAFGNRVRPLSYRGLQLLAGWYDPEPWGVWSRGCRVRLKLTVAPPLPPGALLRLECDAAVSPGFPALSFDRIVNGRSVGRSMLRMPERTITIPLAPPGDQTRTYLIELRFDEVRSPMEQSGQPDDRRLGIGLHRAEIVADAAT